MCRSAAGLGCVGRWVVVVPKRGVSPKGSQDQADRWDVRIKGASVWVNGRSGQGACGWSRLRLVLALGELVAVDVLAARGMP